MNMCYLSFLAFALVTALTLIQAQNSDPESLHPQDHRRHHRHSSEAVYWQKIGDQIWVSDYKNPCQSDPDADSSMVSSLSIQNREEVLRAKAGNLLAQLRHLERFVVSQFIFY